MALAQLRLAKTSIRVFIAYFIHTYFTSSPHRQFWTSLLGILNNYGMAFRDFRVLILCIKARISPQKLSFFHNFVCRGRITVGLGLEARLVYSFGFRTGYPLSDWDSGGRGWHDLDKVGYGLLRWFVGGFGNVITLSSPKLFGLRLCVM